MRGVYKHGHWWEDVFFALIVSLSKKLGGTNFGEVLFGFKWSLNCFASKEARGDGCGMLGKTPFGFKFGDFY